MKNNRGIFCSQACQICKASDLSEVQNFSLLPRITSDCRPFKAGGKLFVCLYCGCVQKIPDTAWLKETEEIYSHYETYYQSGGDEQIIFDRITGQPRRRSEVILERLSSGKHLKEKGCVLDVGCGNGATLRTMSDKLTEWSFSGYELGSGNLQRLSGIPRFKNLYTGLLTGMDERFDLVTLIHSLEHFPSPGDVLAQLLPLVENGKIFIEVSNVEENPFDILIADHLMHFSPKILSDLLRRAGFIPVIVATDWVSKEISLLATRNNKERDETGFPVNDPSAGHALSRITTYVGWLRRLADQVRGLTVGEHSFGIFGTSIAATWLAGMLPDGVDFFVDEDPSRIGKEHRGSPILHPSQVPENAKVYFALVPELAETIAQRFKAAPFEKVLPVPVKPVRTSNNIL